MSTKLIFIGGTKNPISIVALKGENNTYQIGVARCGHLDTYNKELGLEIAENRAIKQPWAKDVKMTRHSFELYIAPAIVSNQRCMKQSNLQSIRLVKAK